jgi:SNF2 family DNA or RNA helicase
LIDVKTNHDRFFVTGTGLEFLRIKSLIASRIGAEVVRPEGRDHFSIPIECLGAVADLIPPIGSAEETVERIRKETTLHEQARLKCLEIVDNEDEGHPSPPWDTILDYLQAVAVNAMTQKGLKGLCLFDEQGLGKTVMTIAAFDSLKEMGDIDAGIVVCPKSMLREWEGDVHRLIPDKYRVGIVEGDSEEKNKIVLQANDLCLVNYDSVSRIQISLEAVARRARTLLVVDESYYVKNPDAIRSDAVRDLRRSCARCFVLCGTPAPNSPIDLVHQFDVADDGYTYLGFRPSGDIVRDRPRIELAMRSRGVFIRRLKSEMLPDLPEKHFRILQVPLSGRQADLYEGARNNLTLWLRGMDNKTFQKSLADYFSRRQVLLQICSCPDMIDPLFSGSHAKLLALDKLIDRIVTRAHRKVVLWSYYKRSLQELEARYQHLGMVRVDGSTLAKDRRIAIDKFQKSTGIAIFLGNPAAAGAGITLHAASDAIYFSYPGQAAHYLQSLDRIHRRGQTAPEVRFHLLVCKRTIEEREVSRLRRKELDQQDLLGDTVPWPSSIDDALAELQGATH